MSESALPPSEALDAMPEIHRAAAVGDHKTLRTRLSRGDDVELIHPLPHALGGNATALATPLYVAAGSRFGATAETVRLLLEAGANPRHDSTVGSPAVAAAMGWVGTFRPGDANRLAVLLAAGSPLPTHEESVARMVAHVAGHGEVECLRLLLEAGLSPNPIADVAGYEGRSNAMVAELLANSPSLLSPFGDGDDAMNEFWNEITSQLPVPSMPSRPGPPQFLCPLHSAASAGNAAAVRLLLAHGADPAASSDEGRTPIDVATSAECIELLSKASGASPSDSDLDALLERLGDEPTDPLRALIRQRVEDGVPIQRDSHHGGDVLYHYAFAQNLPAVELLIELGIPVRTQGRTALHAIAWHSCEQECPGDVDFPKFTRLLLGAGIPPDARDDHGSTPLHEAVAGDGANRPVLDELLSAGADINARNDEGQTPLVHLYESCFGYEKPDLVQRLVDAGANPNLRDRHGQSAIDVAHSRARGEEPRWRRKQFEGRELPCGWKAPAEPGSGELESLRILEEVAERYPDDEASERGE